MSVRQKATYEVCNDARGSLLLKSGYHYRAPYDIVSFLFMIACLLSILIIIRLFIADLLYLKPDWSLYIRLCFSELCC